MLLFLPVTALADDECKYLFCNPLRESVWGGVTNIQGALVVLVDLFIQISMPIAAIYIIWTGYTFATSKGNQTKIDEARRMLTYLVVGLAIMLAAKGIGMAIQDTIGTVAGPGTVVGGQ